MTSCMNNSLPVVLPPIVRVGFCVSQKSVIRFLTVRLTVTDVRKEILIARFLAVKNTPRPTVLYNDDSQKKGQQSCSIRKSIQAEYNLVLV